MTVLGATGFGLVDFGMEGTTITSLQFEYSSTGAQGFENKSTDYSVHTCPCVSI